MPSTCISVVSHIKIFHFEEKNIYQERGSLSFITMKGDINTILSETLMFVLHYVLLFSQTHMRAGCRREDLEVTENVTQDLKKLHNEVKYNFPCSYALKICGGMKVQLYHS
jgi:hypothetical protein